MIDSENPEIMIFSTGSEVLVADNEGKESVRTAGCLQGCKIKLR